MRGEENDHVRCLESKVGKVSCAIGVSCAGIAWDCIRGAFWGSFC
jgi:hypothetical protein